MSEPGKTILTSVHADGGTRPVHGGMIVRQADPVNLEMPFGSLQDFITPTDEFFVRCHFPIPLNGPCPRHPGEPR